MERTILVYGNSDKSPKGGFPTADDFDHYIREGVYLDEDGRYRYTQTKEADVILLSRDGLLHGHFEIAGKEPPNERDRAEWPQIKAAYLVRASFLYGNRVPLSNFGITGIQFGKAIAENTFREILEAAGEVARFDPNSIMEERNRVLRAIEERRGQAAFRNCLINSFNGRCAVTGCDAVDALEAAHIDPYSEGQSNHPSNGLLLRCDIHTLFDLNLLGINPSTLEVAIAGRLEKTSYADVQGRVILMPKGEAEHPSHEALERRWLKFTRVRDNL